MKAKGRRKRYQWIVVRAQPRREGWAQENIRRQGYQSYCPRFLDYDNKVKCLFPGYLFVRTWGPWYWLKGTFGVLAPVMVGDIPARIPRAVVEGFRKSQDRKTKLVKFTTRQFKDGQQIRITGGPFAELVGKFDGLDANGRVRMLLDFLGQEVRTIVHPGYVQAA